MRNSKYKSVQIVQYVSVQSILFLGMVLLLQTPVFCQDAFTQKVSDFVTSTVLPWTRLVGALVMIGGIIGLGLNRQREEKLKTFWEVLGVGALIFLIPELINLVYAKFSGGSIDVLR